MKAKRSTIPISIETLKALKTPIYYCTTRLPPSKETYIHTHCTSTSSSLRTECVVMPLCLCFVASFSANFRPQEALRFPRKQKAWETVQYETQQQGQIVPNNYIRSTVIVLFMQIILSLTLPLFKLFFGLVYNYRVCVCVTTIFAYLSICIIIAHIEHSSYTLTLSAAGCRILQESAWRRWGKRDH